MAESPAAGTGSLVNSQMPKNAEKYLNRATTERSLLQSAVLSAIATCIITWDMDAQKAAQCKLLGQHHLLEIFGASPLDGSRAGEYLNVLRWGYSFFFFTMHVSFEPR